MCNGAFTHPGSYWRITGNLHRRVASLSTLALILLMSACGSDSAPPPADPGRPFYMGFTPWPYDATLDAVNTTYARIQQHGDMIVHQLMQGIPWEAAYNQTPYPASVEGDIQSRLAQTRPDSAVFLAVDSLNALRTGLAGDWTDNGEQARTAPWDGRDFDSAVGKRAWQ